jgi:hypothetical protein
MRAPPDPATEVIQAIVHLLFRIGVVHQQAVVSTRPNVTCECGCLLAYAREPCPNCQIPMRKKAL